MREDDNKSIEIKKFVELAAIVIGLLFLFLFLLNMNRLTAQKKDVDLSYGKLNETDLNQAYHNRERFQTTRDSANIYLVGGVHPSIKNQLEFNKLNFSELSDFSEQNMFWVQDGDIIITSGRAIEKIERQKQLTDLLKKDVIIILSELPNIEFIKENHLEETFGMRGELNSTKWKGVRFIKGVYLGGMLDLEELEFPMITNSILSSSKVYAYGLKEDKDKNDLTQDERQSLPGVIWRTIGEHAIFYIVNGPFLEASGGSGLLNFILSQVYPDFLYPALNTRTLAVYNAPYLSNENTDEMQKLYSRDACRVFQDILAPSFIAMCDQARIKPTFFLTDWIRDPEAPLLITKDNLYNVQILKDAKASFALMNGKCEEYIENIKAGILDELHEVDETMLTKFTGIHNTMKKDEEVFNFYSMVTAYGAVVQTVDMERVIYPRTEDDNWIHYSKDIGEAMMTAFSKFSKLNSGTVWDLENSVKYIFASEPEFLYQDRQIQIKLPEIYQKMSYILRTDKEIASMSSGEYQLLEAGCYLIEINEPETVISLKIPKKAIYGSEEPQKGEAEESQSEKGTD